jgi:hypothetical protein
MGSIPEVTSQTRDVVPVGGIVKLAQFRMPCCLMRERSDGLSVFANPPFKNFSGSNAGNDPFSFASSTLFSYAAI